MNFPPPSAKQAQVIWFSATILAAAVVIAALGASFWVLGVLLNKLASVVLPLAIAGIVACLLDPVVNFLQRRLMIPRMRAIFMVFFIGLAIVVLMLGTVVPQLVVQADELVQKAPTYAEKFRTQFSDWLASSPLGQKAKEAWDKELGEKVQEALKDIAPLVSSWLIDHLGNVTSWLGYAVGLALVPVYLFYFLIEKSGIQSNWTDFLPVRESAAKEELVFVLSSINDCIIVFFRGQILVSICSGVLLGIGLSLAGLNYAVLLGALAAVVCVLPYVGAIIIFALASILAGVHYSADPNIFWKVIGIFLFVQAAEGLVYSPRILGNRVGLHPLTIIICVMVGAKLLGGLLGGLLAIPLTAAARTLMFRYVWKRPTSGPATVVQG